MNNKTVILKALSKVRKHFHGPVTRKDGSLVPMAIDTRPLLWYPKPFRDVSRVLAAKVRPLRPDAIAGGLTGGAIWASAVAIILGKPFIMLRKKSRGYSIDYGCIEGVVKPGLRVVLIDDGFVSGAMLSAFSKMLIKVKAKILACTVIILVIPQNAKKWIKKHRLPIRHLITYPEIIDGFYKRGYIDKELHLLISAFINNPSGWQKNKELYKLFYDRLKQSKHWRVIK